MREVSTIWRMAVIVAFATAGGCADPEPDAPDSEPLAEFVLGDEVQKPELHPSDVAPPVLALPEPVFQRVDAVEPAFFDPRFSAGSPCGGPLIGSPNFVGGTLRSGAIESNGTATLQLSDAGLRHQISSGWPLFVTCIRADSRAFWREVEGGITVELDTDNSIAYVTATYRGVSSSRYGVYLVPER